MSNPFKINNTIFFLAANDNAKGLDLWKSDGTEAGTTLIKPFGPGPSNLKVVNSTLYFSGFSDGTIWLFKSDTTSAGILKVKNMAIPDQAYFTELDGMLYFTAYDEGVLELWKSDGTNSGTVKVVDNNSSLKPSGTSFLTKVNNTIFFVAKDENSNQMLWKTDSNAINLVKSGYLGSFNETSEFAVVNNTLFFTTYRSYNETSLWKSDGTSGGTVRLDKGGLNISHLMAVDNKLFFSGTNSTTGTELWSIGSTTGISDNTIVGNSNKINISPNPFDGSATVTINADISNGAEIILYDMLGKEVRRFEVSTSSFKIERGELADGIYTLQWLNGNNTISQRLVIMR